MKVIPFTRDSAHHYFERLRKVHHDRPPLWGTMQPPAMMAHLRRSIELSLGEYPVENQSNFITRSALLRWIAFGPIPFPKGARAPVYFHPSTLEDFESERSSLLAALERFLDAHEKDPDRREVSQIFGPMPLRYWSRIHGKHMDHHLRQFGS